LILLKKSAAVAAAFGLVSSIFVAVIGDEHAYEVANTQLTKIASMEGLIVGERGAPIVAFGIPKTISVEEMKNMTNNDGTFLFEIPIPHLLSILGKRSFNAFVPGIKDLVYGNPEYGIWSFEKLREEGKKAIDALHAYHKAKAEGNTAAMEEAKKNLLWCSSRC
jgi:cytochrome d ubiquinol oxidase subunit I